jgi:replicative DNA helicase
VKKDAGAVLTGLYQLDQIMGGLFPGEMICIAARPGCCKSALSQAIAMNAAKEGKRVLVTSLEMSRIEVGQRILVAKSGVPNWRVRNSKLDKPDADALAAAAERLRGARVRFDDEPGLSMSRFAAKCRVLKRKEGLDLVVLDYLGLLRPDNVRLPRHEQVASMSRAIKILAQELQLPIIILNQLNRDADDANRHPRLSDIRESGAIEQDCDAVILLHRPSDERNDPDPIDLIVAKQRSGETGMLRLMFRGSTFRFESEIPKM